MESFEGIEIDVAISYLSRFVILREVAEQWNAKWYKWIVINEDQQELRNIPCFYSIAADSMAAPVGRWLARALPPCGQTGEALRDDLPCLLHQLANDLTGRLDLFGPGQRPGPLTNPSTRYHRWRHHSAGTP